MSASFHKNNIKLILAFWVFTLLFQSNIYFSINWNTTKLLFLVSVILCELIGIYWIYNKFCYEPKKIKIDKPEFEPPDLLPWQASHLISEGKIDSNSTFLAYLLWLNHKKIIDIQNFKQNLIINSELPKILPQHYNNLVKLLNVRGWRVITTATNDLKIVEQNTETNTWLSHILKDFYQNKPIILSPGIFLAMSLMAPVLVYILIFFVPYSYFMFRILRDPNNKNVVSSQMSNRQFLWVILFMFSWLGVCVVFSIFLNTYNLNEFLFLIGLSLTLILPIYLFVWSRWGKLSQKGYYYWLWSKQYRFYLEKAEKEKLNFANNLEMGIQSYLPQVAFAAQFGFLEKLEKDLAKKLI